jgi:hypothetical protein
MAITTYPCAAFKLSIPQYASALALACNKAQDWTSMISLCQEAKSLPTRFHEKAGPGKGLICPGTEIFIAD